jgi:hypothetical protein
VALSMVWSYSQSLGQLRNKDTKIVFNKQLLKLADPLNLCALCEIVIFAFSGIVKMLV